MKALKISIILFLLLGLYACGVSNSPKAPVAVAEQVHEEDEHEVSLTEAQVQAAGIELGAIEQKNLEESIKVSGKLEVPAQNKAAITSLYAGVVQQLLVHPGSSVVKGQVIATIANTELAGLQQNLISVTAQAQLARLEYTRQQELVAGNAAPLKNLQRAEAEWNSLKAQQAALGKQLAALGIRAASVHTGNISATLEVRAPISGTISDIHALIGSRVDAATPVAEIVNNSQLHLDLFVYEKDLPAIRKGQTIHFTLTNNPGKEYDATIFAIGTAFANDSRSVPVHADVEGDKSGLIEGMSVTAIISIGARKAAAIPTEAIVANAGKDYIFILKDEAEPEHAAGAKQSHEEQETPGNWHFERVQVVRGATDLGYTEVQAVTELPANARIIVRGAFFVMAKMTNTGEHEH